MQRPFRHNRHYLTCKGRARDLSRTLPPNLRKTATCNTRTYAILEQRMSKCFLDMRRPTPFKAGTRARFEATHVRRERIQEPATERRVGKKWKRTAESVGPSSTTEAE